MNVDTMRKIDYYAGVPLCFLATSLIKILDWFTGKPGFDAPQRSLFVELSEMGSAIVVDPAMRKLRDSGSEIYFVIFKNNAGSLRLLGTVPEENVFTIDAEGLWPLLKDTLRFLWWTRKSNIDTVIDLELFSRYTALLTGLSGAKRRVGYHAFHNEGLYRGDMLTHKVSYNAHQHMVKNFVALVNAALSDKNELPYSKTIISEDEIKLAKTEIDPAEKEAMLGRIASEAGDVDVRQHRVVLINPNASDLLPQRRWMPEHFVAVMKMLVEQYDDVLVLITGAPNEREQAEQLCQQVSHPRCINFAGKQRLDELPTLYSISTLMLTNDSGPGHFSAITDLKTFVIFGPETPALYGSLGNSTPIYAGLSCSPCVSASNHRKTPCTDNVCLQVITPEQVMQKLQPVLESPAA